MRGIVRHYLCFVVGLSCCLLLRASTASADVTIQATTAQQSDSVYTIEATSNQTLTLNVSGGTSIQGANVYLQIADGGADNGGTANNGGATVPTISSINLTQGIFTGSSDEPFITSDSLIAYDAVNTTSNAYVTATGLLGTVTLNATGVTPGSEFTFQLYDVAPNYFGPDATSYWTSGQTSADFTGDAMSTPFTIKVVALPEPAMASILLGGVVVCLLRRRTTRRQCVS